MDVGRELGTGGGSVTRIGDPGAWYGWLTAVEAIRRFCMETGRREQGRRLS